MIMMIMNCRFINKSALRNWLKILLLTLSEFRQSDYFRGNSSWLIHLNLLNINSKIWVPSLSFISSRGSLLQVYFNSNLDPIGEDLNLCRVKLWLCWVIVRRIHHYYTTTPKVLVSGYSNTSVVPHSKPLDDFLVDMWFHGWVV